MIPCMTVALLLLFLLFLSRTAAFYPLRISASRDEQQLFYGRRCQGRRLSFVIGAHDAGAVMDDSLIFRHCAVFRPAAIPKDAGVFVYLFVCFFPSGPLLFADRNRHRLPAPLRVSATGCRRLLLLQRLICRGSKRIVSCLMNPLTHSLSQPATCADMPTRRVAPTPPPFFFFS